MRRLVGVAVTDFRDRIQSRRLLVVAIAIVYLGYVVNTGQAELVFQSSTTEPQGYSSYYGERTAAYIGISAGVIGAFVMLFAGFYLAKGRLQYDHTTNMDEVVASTPLSTIEYLLGKWLSGVGLLGVLLLVLWAGTLVNHLVYGVGATRPLQILWPILVLGIPVAGLVTGLAVLVGTTTRLTGTLGNVGYFFLAMTLLVISAAFGGVAPSELSLAAKLTDVIGRFAVYEVTYDAITAINPEYRGAGLGIGSRRSAAEATALFRITTVDFPLWVFLARFGLLAFGGGLAGVGAVLHTRWRSAESTGGSGLLGRLRDSLGGADTDEPASTTGRDDISLTPVRDRSAAGIGSLYWLELREVLRGHRWWWYLGGLGIIGAGLLGLTGASLPREPLLALALVWPVFVWSGLGSRPERHQTTSLLVSSPSVYRQLLAVWLVGVTVAAVFIAPVHWGTVSTNGPLTGLALVSVIVFVPSFALAAGVWTRTGRAFEAIYLPLWYLALNGVGWADFAGFSSAHISTGAPLAFGAIGIVALATAIYRRTRATI